LYLLPLLIPALYTRSGLSAILVKPSLVFDPNLTKEERTFEAGSLDFNLSDDNHGFLAIVDLDLGPLQELIQTFIDERLKMREDGNSKL